MAQLVEQRIRNAWVAGSSPAVGSMKLQVSRLCGWPVLLLREDFLACWVRDGEEKRAFRASSCLVFCILSLLRSAMLRFCLEYSN